MTFGDFFQLDIENNDEASGSTTPSASDTQEGENELYRELFKEIKCTTNYSDLYFKAFNLVINRAKKENSVNHDNGSQEANKKYINNPDLQYLTIGKTEEPLTIKITANGEEHFKNTILNEKKSIFERIKNKNTGTTDEEDANTTEKTDKKIEEIDKDIETRINEIEFNDNKEFTYITKNKEEKTKFVNTFTNIIYSDLKEDKLIKSLKKSDLSYDNNCVKVYFHSLTQTEQHQLAIIKNIINGTRDRHIENKSKNKKRCKKIIDLQVLGSDFFKKNKKHKLRKSQNNLPNFYKNIYKYIKTALVTYHKDKEKNSRIFNNIICAMDSAPIGYSCAATVRGPAIKKFKNDLRSKYGITELEKAKNLKYDKKKILKNLYKDLLSETNRLLNSLPLETKEKEKVNIFTLTNQNNSHIITSVSFKNDNGEIKDTKTTTLNTPTIKEEIKKEEEATINITLENNNNLFLCTPIKDSHIAKNFTINNDNHTIDFSNKTIAKGKELVVDESETKPSPSIFNKFINGMWQYKWNALYALSKEKTYIIGNPSGGHGMGRTDNINEENYLLEIKPNSTANQKQKEKEKEISRITDQLELENNKNKTLKKFKITIEGKHYTLAGDNGTLYIQTNTPYTTTNRITQTEPNNLPFSINYYRKIATDENNRYKVIKPKNNNKNRPDSDDITSPIDDSIPLNLPICMNMEDNYTEFRKNKKGRGVIKKKSEGTLGTSSSTRLDAGTVMRELRDFFIDKILPHGSRLSASDMCKAVFRQPDSEAKKDWNTLKDTTAYTLPVNQEWCHLKGHGDGGKEELGNFVSGSFHCNTEQLAIEMGQRSVTHKNKGIFTLHATAYLLKDESLDENKKSDKIKVFGNIKPEGQNKVLTNGDEKTTSKDIHTNNAPIAAYIRYKIYKNENGRKQKIFDYVFEGQSEFFDKNQFRILSATVKEILEKSMIPGCMKETVSPKGKTISKTEPKKQDSNKASRSNSSPNSSRSPSSPLSGSPPPRTESSVSPSRAGSQSPTHRSPSIKRQSSSPASYTKPTISSENKLKRKLDSASPERSASRSEPPERPKKKTNNGGKKPWH